MTVVKNFPDEFHSNKMFSLYMFFFCPRVGADVDVSIEDLSLSGRVQIVFEMDHLVPFPHMKAVSVTFLEK